MNLILNIILTSLYFAIQFATPTLPQDPKYHSFAGDGLFRFSCCQSHRIPNAANVFSNLPFAIVGLTGLVFKPMTSLAWHGFCWGSILVCFGSAYYHWNPNNVTLVWDRLPMTLCTTSISYIILRHHQVVILDDNDLIFWWIIGVVSVIYWHVYDDLRLYAYVQYFPVFCILVLSIYAPVTDSLLIIAAILLYIIARVCEYFDFWFYRNFDISGHVIKHVLCSISMLWCLLIQ